jgi:hypothetical protein
MLTVGCSSGGSQNVFALQGGYTTGFPTHTLEVDDIGLSHGWLYNTTDHSVHIVSIRFVASPATLRMLNVLAYSWADTHNTGLINDGGVLSKECPSQFKPHPLSVVTVAPHANANWLVVIAFRISKPGVYHLDQVRIDYETQGHKGWQYQNVNTTVTVKNPPLPGPTPIPASAICYNPKTAP